MSEVVEDHAFIYFSLAPSKFDCDFEQDLCSWSQITNGQDQFNWKRSQGKTNSVGTGPSFDHTTGNCKSRKVIKACTL